MATSKSHDEDDYWNTSENKGFDFSGDKVSTQLEI